MKQKLARYNLQFCAVSSQLSNHSAAIEAVSKSHSLMIECVHGCSEEFKKIWQESGKNLQEIHLLLDFLNGLSVFAKKIEQIDHNDLSKSILKAAHFSIQLWSESKSKLHPSLP